MATATKVFFTFAPHFCWWALRRIARTNGVGGACEIAPLKETAKRRRPPLKFVESQDPQSVAAVFFILLEGTER
jgi:hypothetical protein